MLIVRIWSWTLPAEYLRDFGHLKVYLCHVVGYCVTVLYPLPELTHKVVSAFSGSLLYKGHSVSHPASNNGLPHEHLLQAAFDSAFMTLLQLGFAMSSEFVVHFTTVVSFRLFYTHWKLCVPCYMKLAGPEFRRSQARHPPSCLRVCQYFMYRFASYRLH